MLPISVTLKPTESRSPLIARFFIAPISNPKPVPTPFGKSVKNGESGIAPVLKDPPLAVSTS